MKKIPSIIHQIWVGSHPKPEKLMQTWKDKHPDFKFFEWNNETVKKMKWRCQKQIDQMWAAERWNGVADLIRYEVLSEFGGFVAPADSICLNPIDDLLPLGLFCCFENEKVRPGLLSPHIGACPKDKLIEGMIEFLEKQDDVLYDEVWKVTGNALLTRAVASNAYPIAILPSFTFIPEHYTGCKYEEDGTIYAKHFWGSTKQITDKLDEQI
jgi:mannosyltransferase OCH1-like enzyme